MIDGKMSVEEVVQLVGKVAKPTSPWEWAGRPPGNADFPALCRFCGDDLRVEVLQPDDGKGLRVRIGHDVPICPEFVQFTEDLST